jgi:dUTP pyrophosphatase
LEKGVLMQVNCHNCGKEFKVTPSRFKRNKTHCCSKECMGIISSKRQSRKVKTNCTVCDNVIYYKKSHFKEIAYPTCSRVCAAKSKSERQKGRSNPNALRLTPLQRFMWDRCLNYQYRAKCKDIDFNLDYLFLESLYHKQDKKCYYSGINLKIKGEKSYDTISLDRVDSSKGYTKDNVVFCLNCVNMFKSDHSIDDIQKVIQGFIMKENLKVNIKKLSEDAIIPKKAHPQDAGFDITSVSKSYKKCPSSGEIMYVEYGTGLAFELPKNHVGLLFPRSSISKTSLSLCNSVGVLDENYTGEVAFRFKVKDARFSELPTYEIGERIGQIIIMPYPKIEFNEVEELSETDRGNGGFGSSGK